jgi:hypothetical protein
MCSTFDVQIRFKTGHLAGVTEDPRGKTIF